jgi:hypothetical protein
LEAPKDVDVVTFFHLPNGLDEATFSPKVADLFDVENTKKAKQLFFCKLIFRHNWLAG